MRTWMAPSFALVCIILAAVACSNGPVCPAVADTCASVCTFVRLAPVDRAKKCTLPARTFGCADGPGPAVVRCSIKNDTGDMFLSNDGRIVPGGRICTDDEARSIDNGSIPPC
jgi:hypothetical protein